MEVPVKPCCAPVFAGLRGRQQRGRSSRRHVPAGVHVERDTGLTLGHLQSFATPGDIPNRRRIGLRTGGPLLTNSGP